MSELWLKVLPDPDAAAGYGAVMIAERLRKSIDQKGEFRLALSGGSTPIAMFEVLAGSSLPWDLVTIYQVDERVVPLADPARNLGHIIATLGATGAKIVPMSVEDEDLLAAVIRYQRELPDAFDLVQLGLGPDGHTASLVPKDSVLEISDQDVALSAPYQGQRRMTLTFRGLSRAEEVLWLVTGAEKGEALMRLCSHDLSIPAARVVVDRAVIVADEAAAQLVTAALPQGVQLWH